MHLSSVSRPSGRDDCPYVQRVEIARYPMAFLVRSYGRIRRFALLCFKRRRLDPCQQKPLVYLNK